MNTFNLEITEEMNALCQDILYFYKGQIDRIDAIATGNLRNNAKCLCKYKGTTFEIYMELPDYYKYIDEGRGPSAGSGNGSLFEKIKQWIQVKKLQVPLNKKGVPQLDSLAYVITRKIHKKGYEARPIFEPIQNQIDSITDRMEELIMDQIFEYAEENDIKLPDNIKL